MTTARVRLFAAAVLFVGWVAWLGYLAATSADLNALSRPQLLVTDAVVKARLRPNDTGTSPADAITVEEVLLNPAGDGKLRAGEPLAVVNLSFCGPGQGWQGEGEYLVPLSSTTRGGYLITAIPYSPGYEPPPATQYDPRLRVYRWDRLTGRQWQVLRDELELGRAGE